MKITIESTNKIVELNGVPARVWEGHTESGIPLHCFITRVSVKDTEDTTQFEKELQEHKVPENADIQGIPLRLII